MARKNLSLFAGCSATLLACGCSAALDFEQVSSQYSAVEGAPTGRITTHLDSDVCVEVAPPVRPGAKIQLWKCTHERAQQWTTARDDTLRSHGRCLDFFGSAAPGAKLQLAECSGARSQEWIELNGEVLNPSTGLCIEATGSVAVEGTMLQAEYCTGSARGQRWRLPAPKESRLFGPNVLLFDPYMSRPFIQRRLNAVFRRQQQNAFGFERYALLFKPGRYDVAVPLGFFTQLAGLGLSPDDVSILGPVDANPINAPGRDPNQNYWRSVENLTVFPDSNTVRWAGAKGTAYRRVHVSGDLLLGDATNAASGGILADSQIDGEVSADAQQWFARNNTWLDWKTPCETNMVFVGNTRAPSSSPCTSVQTTPTLREKPFLYIDDNGEFRVFVPALRSDTQGPSWLGQSPSTDQSLPLDRFESFGFGANGMPPDTAARFNAALAEHKHLLIGPGLYHLEETVRITEPDTIVLGLGVPTLVAEGEDMPGIAVADVDGVKLLGFMVDAGKNMAQPLIEVGPPGSNANHSQNPSSLHDIYVRVGGRSDAGIADVSLQINSSHVVADNVFLWRADHGRADANSVGWTENPAATGLIVAGNDVTLFGISVDHYQAYQTIWRGDNGRTYFYSSETPYDVPRQKDWMNDTSPGWATYTVDPGVSTHEAWGLASDCHFNANPDIELDHAFEAPPSPGISLHDMVTARLHESGTIRHVFNDVGDAVNDDNPLSRCCDE